MGAVGKTTGDNPFAPSWRLNGDYWQWGHKNYSAPGPTGPGAAEANDGPIAGWDKTNASDGAWSDMVKTGYDPCPVGYRVPTEAQWFGMLVNNPSSVVGTWTLYGKVNTTNYNAARLFGDHLMLPAAGYRYSGITNGSLFQRGFIGNYWSSTEHALWEGGARDLRCFNGGSVYIGYSERNYGMSVRCIAE